MSVNYELKDLDVSKLPETIRELLDGSPNVNHTPYHTIFYTETHDKPSYFEGIGKEQQVLCLGYTLIEEDGTPKRFPSYKTDENGNTYKLTDDHIAEGFTLMLVDPSEITYPLNEYFESIKL